MTTFIKYKISPYRIYNLHKNIVIITHINKMQIYIHMYIHVYMCVHANIIFSSNKTNILDLEIIN